MRRHAWIWIACLVASALAACTPDARYRALSVFFDGVPKPGEQPRAKSKGPALPGAPPVSTASLLRASNPGLNMHAPFRDNQCRDCHDPNGRWLPRTVEDGLCQQCHSIPRDFEFVHEPAAENACLTCHHYHESALPKLLLAAPRELCLRCHRQEDLSPAAHHAAIGQSTCIECHDPHGGQRRYFLKSDRTDANE